MLIKKSGDNTETLIPLTTGFITDNEHSSEPYSSFKLNMMCNTEKVVFPGENAAFAARYSCFDTSTNEYTSINGTITTFGAGGNWGVCGVTADAYDFNDIDAWKYDFRRVSNWRDYVNTTAKTDETESANYIANETTTVTIYNNISNYNEYRVQITDFFKASTYDIPESGWWVNKPGELIADISFVLQDTVYDGEPDEWCYALAINNASSKFLGTRTFSAYFTAHCENLKDWANLHHNWPTWNLGSDYSLRLSPDGNYCLYSLINGFLGHELYYKSSSAAYVNNIEPLRYVSDITGNDVHFKFNSEGTNVTGSAYTGTNTSHTATITADVEYVLTETQTAYPYSPYSPGPEVTSNSGFDTYDWKTKGYIGEIGGGCSFSYGFTSYLPNKNTKWAISPRNNTTLNGHDANSYYDLSTKRIQDSYGGSILFSGTNLDNYWEDNSRYFFIGFKGMNPYITGDNCYSTITNNTEMKIYKFNSDHFKKISQNTYYFEDKDISKIYANAASIANTRYRRHYAIGPNFYELTGYIKTYNATGGEEYNFNMITANNITHNVTPKVLNTIQYVNTLGIDEADDYFIVKPSNSISTTYNKSLCNYGNTDTYSYFAYRLPTYWSGLPSFILNSNATEISKLGKTLKWCTQIFGNNTQLTAIKTDWTYCNNIYQMCFSGTPLKQLPSSWNGLTNLTAMYNGFESCTQLTTIPDSWEGLNNLIDGVSLFKSCNLSAIPNSWNGLGSLTGAPSMFSNCRYITTIPDDWSPLVNIEYAPEMFYGCTQLTGINSWQGCKIKYTQRMFANCTHLSKVPSSWSGLSNVTNADEMFANCTNLTRIPTDLFTKCPNITQLSAMFSGCIALTSDIKPIMDDGIRKFGFNTNAYNGAFKGCTSVSSYNTLTSNAAYKKWFGL